MTNQEPVPTGWPSIEVVYTEIKDRVALQMSQSDVLDAKANFVFGSASLLTAGLAALRNAARPAPNESLGDWEVLGLSLDKMLVINVVTAAALAAFVGVLFCSLMAYRLRDFRITPGPREKAPLLRDKWSAYPPDMTKAMLTDSRIKYDLPHNEQRIDEKTRWTRLSLYSLMFEAALLLVFAVLQVLV